MIAPNANYYQDFSNKVSPTFSNFMADLMKGANLDYEKIMSNIVPILVLIAFIILIK